MASKTVGLNKKTESLANRSEFSMMKTESVEKKAAYKVGYKKPPLGTRFEPGKSGNPKGRPKRSGATFNEMFDKELSILIPFSNGSKQQAIPASQAIIKKQIHRALSGEAKSLAWLMQKMEQRDSSQKKAIAPILEAMQAIHAKHEAADSHASGAVRREQALNVPMDKDRFDT